LPPQLIPFALEGSRTLLSAAPAALVSRLFPRLRAFVGVGQRLHVLVAARPATPVLRRLFSMRSVIYPVQEARS
jgi:hypothetical protein